jgi:hypothetical protein
MKPKAKTLFTEYRQDTTSNYKVIITKCQILFGHDTYTMTIVSGDDSYERYYEDRLLSVSNDAEAIRLGLAEWDNYLGSHLVKVEL